MGVSKSHNNTHRGGDGRGLHYNNVIGETEFSLVATLGFWKGVMGAGTWGGWVVRTEGNSKMLKLLSAN